LKKLLAIALVIALAFGTFCACAAGIVDYIRGQGFTPSSSDNADGTIRCDLIVTGSSWAAVEWSDSALVYSVSGDEERVARLYLDALGMGAWDSCRYVLENKARISYGANSAKRCETLAEYIDAVQGALDLPPLATEAPNRAETPSSLFYVVNTNTRKFHYPNCPSVRTIKAKNRKDYHGSREELIAKGYSPCKRCRP